MRHYQLRRLSDLPIIQTSDVKPSLSGFEVLGAFNPAACYFNGEILLLLRVAEAPPAEKGFVIVPLIEEQDGVPVLTIKRFPEPAGPYDPRVVTLDGKVYLTSISHLRLARSHDGIHFTIDEKPFLFPARMDESFGIEDARITFLEGKYWITYTAVSEHGPGVGLAVTTDFETIERMGMILPPPNKDVALFPQKINGKYMLLHRPMISEIGKPSVWLAESTDGVHWGNHKFLFGGRGQANSGELNEPFAWEGGKIGAGPEPIATDKGWLVCYHGADATHAYALALALLDSDDPSKVLDRSTTPLLTPELDWERDGFFPNVVFANGWVQWPAESDHAGEIWVYYGAADSGVGLAELVQI
ncbi:glycoside hydrolase family 130 protein [Spirosoma linguale]|uniref:Glycosidase PH1107-related protein n=1 Tax=Spirosoma linguale (strain ATCC 33905 / DSM 74 / LMG 10896 / Claus 1) TaxID=504472 RepID=D2QH65_SPILD|nr:glycosidase PH1107-related protein [Spirosoma linguale DSM 74]